MPMKMEPVEVYVGDEGHICIKQDLGSLDDAPDCVVLHPSQAQMVTEWIMRCAPEAEAVTAAGGSDGWHNRIAQLEAECGKLREELARAQEELAQEKADAHKNDGSLN